jgi:hypothetical protein
MPVTQVADVVVPAEFTAYQVEKSMVSTPSLKSGVAVRNNGIPVRSSARSALVHESHLCSSQGSCRKK